MALSQIKGSTGIADATITSAKLADFTAAVDLNGVELLLDADADTSISADTDDQIDIKIAGADHLKILSSSGDTVLKPMVDAKDIIFQQFDGNKVFEINDGNFVSVGGNATAAGQIRIYEDTDNGSHYSGFTVGNLTASVAYQLPDADGSSGQALITDGSGVLSFTTLSANTPSSADGQALGSASLEWSDLFLADGGTIQFGNDQDVTLTHVADTGLLLSATDQLQFGDSGTYIHQSADGVLDLVSDTEIEINATTIDVNGNLDVSGTIVSAGTITGTLATAAQANVTSLGTLTTLTVDNVIVNGTTIGHTDDTDLITLADGIATVAGELSVTTLDIGGTNVTSTAAELNLLDGVSGLVQADLTKLAAVDSTAAELNIVDGGTSATSTTVADADRVVMNDNGTMVQVAVTDLSAYFDDEITAMPNLVTVGAANTLTTLAGIPFYQGDTGSIYTHDVSSTDSTAQYNTAYGLTALDAITTGDNNTAIGYGAGSALQDGDGNVCVGTGAGNDLTSGANNIAIGQDALAQTTTTDANIAIGRNALQIPDTEANNLAIGHTAMSGSIAGGEYNVAVGNLALSALTSADYNVAIGYEAGSSLTTHNSDVLIGYQAGKALSTGDDGVIAIGYQAGLALTTCSSSVFIGKNAGDGHDTEDHNMGIGRNALTGSVAGGEYNVGIGNYSLAALTSADNNVAIGYLAGSSITTGGTNTMVGFEAGKDTVSGTGNTFIGEQSGRANTGSSNVGIGRDTLYTNTNGNENVAIGDGALTTLNDTGGTNEADYNVAIGYQASSNLTTAFKNTAIGFQAGNRGTTSGSNVLIGYQTYGAQTSYGQNNLVGSSSGQSMTSAYYNQSLGSSTLSSCTEGYNNIAIGHDAGMTVTTGNHNMYIGYKTKANDATDVYSILIGHGDGINNFTSGGGNTVRIGRRVGYITNDFSANATWSHSSDERYKKDITNNTDCGLDFINELRPITYKWKAQSELDTDLPEYDKDETSAIHTAKNYGLIAQEVKAALDKLNITDFGGWKIDSTHEKDRQEISEQMFVYPLIKAVQELSAQVTTLQNEVNTLKGE